MLLCWQCRANDDYESLAEDADLIYQDLSDWKNQFFAEVREDKISNQYIA